MSYQFRWDIIPSNFDFLMSGMQMTLLISATALVFAMIGGLVLALMDLSRFWPLRAVGLSFGELIRNTPILVQLLWVYYVLPIVFAIRITALSAIIIGLSVYMAAFISEGSIAPGYRPFPRDNGRRRRFSVLHRRRASAGLCCRRPSD